MYHWCAFYPNGYTRINAASFDSIERTEQEIPFYESDGLDCLHRPKYGVVYIVKFCEDNRTRDQIKKDWKKWWSSPVHSAKSNFFSILSFLFEYKAI